jgi:hypothetical protein
MKKKLLVLLIAVIPMLMPNLVAAVEVEIDEGALTGSYWWQNYVDRSGLCEYLGICDSN